MDLVKIMLALILLSYTMAVNGASIDCTVVKCYYPPDCIVIPAHGQCCPKCSNGNRQDKSCKYEVGEGKDKVKVNIPDGKSKNVECNKCTCSDGVLECTEIACAES